MFSMRIVSTDFYLAKPIQKFDVCYSEFRRSPAKRVPVIRIFGSTPAGQKTCLHVHGVFPYLYVPYDGTQPIHKYLLEFAISVDTATQAAMGNSSSNNPLNTWQQVVFKISIVNGMPLYGYHDEERQFLKIYLYNPNLVGKVAELLLAGAVLNKVFQPHESHIPFILQFFIDYNLYGMNWIKLAAVKFRCLVKDEFAPFGSPLGETSHTPIITSTLATCSPYRSPGHRLWNDESVTMDMMNRELDRMSTCELEVDCVAADIMNRLDLQDARGINPGIKAIWEDEKQRRLCRHEASQITPPATQERYPAYEGSLETEFKRLVGAAIKQNETSKNNQDITSSSENDVMDALQIPATPSCRVDVHSSDFEHRVCNAIGSGRRSENSIDPEFVDLLTHLRSSDDSSSFLSDSQLLGAKPEEVSILSGSGKIELDASKEVGIAVKHEGEDEEESFLMSQIWKYEEFENDTINEVNFHGEGNAMNSKKSFHKEEYSLRISSKSIEQLDGQDDEFETDPAENVKTKGKISLKKRLHGKATHQVCSVNIPSEPDLEQQPLSDVGSKKIAIVNYSESEQIEGIFSRFCKQPSGGVVSKNFVKDIGNLEIKNVNSTGAERSDNFMRDVDCTEKEDMNFAFNDCVVLLNSKEFDDQFTKVADIESSALTEDLQSLATVTFRSVTGSQENLDDVKNKRKIETEVSLITDHYGVNDISNEGSLDDLSADDGDLCNILYNLSYLSPINLSSPSETPPRPSTPIVDEIQPAVAMESCFNDVNDTHVTDGDTKSDTENISSTELSTNSKQNQVPTSWQQKRSNTTEQCKKKSFEKASLFNLALCYYRDPPSRQDVVETLQNYNIPSAKYQEPFYGNPEDLSAMPIEVGHVLLKLKTIDIQSFREFDTGSVLSFVLGLSHWQSIVFANHPNTDETLARLANQSTFDMGNAMYRSTEVQKAIVGDRWVMMTPSIEPPSKKCVEGWLRNTISSVKRKKHSENDSDDESTLQQDGECIKKQKTVQFDRIAHQLGNHTDDPSLISSVLNEITFDNMNTSSNEEQFKSSGMNESKDNQASTFLRPCSKFKQDNTAKADPTYKTGNKVLREESIEKSSEIIRRNPSNSIMQDISLRTEMRSAPNQNLIPQRIRQRVGDSQIEGPSPKNTYDFRISQHNPVDAKAVQEIQHLTIMSLELHIETRENLNPNPEYDGVRALFYHIYRDIPRSSKLKNSFSGMIVVNKSVYDIETSVNHDSIVSPTVKPDGNLILNDRYSSDDSSLTSPTVRCCRSSRVIDALRMDRRSRMLDRCGITNAWVEYVPDEEGLITSLGLIMRSWDPDILIGYEIQMLSWGYLFDRSKFLKIDLGPKLSRIPEQKLRSQIELTDDSLARYKTDLFVIGRILLNVWRIVRSEVTLNIYSFENVAYHVLHQRIPHYSFRTLTEYFAQDLNRWKVVEYYLLRSRSNFLILHELDTVGLTSEFARLFGIPFYSVLSRGSQFRVESMMLRIAKPMNYIPVSPSPDQRALMRAPEIISLILEPESRFYTDPVVVLDFQSLYPSIIIAYNYCYSTCLGRVKNLVTDESCPFGCSKLHVPLATMKKIEDNYTVSPNGVAFVTNQVRKGVLPRMLEEILSTRVMVKNAMKKNKDNKALEHLLNARQLGLKLISNVTYGYTSANFSGRMPCVEIGDSIVSKARETLTRAIHTVENTPEWRAQVVYGDTDSMFILLKGATKDEAFKIGRQITKRITEANPKPVKLKFEKVYLPCVLETKKRYVGYAYEKEDQVEPIYDAKGIETVRRDGCPAASKILEKSIKMLFSKRDVSLIKRYVLRQCQKLIDGKASVKEFIIAKEYRGRGSYKPGACVPALELAKKMSAVDPRAEPRTGERVPYVVVYGIPGLPLIRLVRRPMELLNDPGLRLNAAYYITKQILPPLNRVFSLIGVSANAWYNELPRSLRSSAAVPQGKDLIHKATISQYFSSLRCPICEIITNHGICSKCRSDPQKTILLLQDRLRRMERTYNNLQELCCYCTGSRSYNIRCESLDCLILFKVYKAKHELVEATHLRQVMNVFSNSGLSRQ